MVGWHHQCNGHELGPTPGDGEEHGSLVCCSPWGLEELDRTWRLRKTATYMDKNWKACGKMKNLFATEVYVGMMFLQEKSVLIMLLVKQTLKIGKNVKITIYDSIYCIAKNGVDK